MLLEAQMPRRWGKETFTTGSPRLGAGRSSLGYRRARYGTPAVLEEGIRKAEEDMSSAAVTQHKEKLDLIGRKGILNDRVSSNNAK